MNVQDRFLKYVSFPTASDENRDTCPSTESQLVLGQYLVDEMHSIGISDAFMDPHGYVYGSIPSNAEDWKGITIGFIAHMDVVDVVPFSDIHPRIVTYTGEEIVLGNSGLTLNESNTPALKGMKGQELIVTDGTTLLGADDKAGIAEILTMAETLLNHPEIKHGEIKIGFTPDEEIGRGADLFDVPGFGADFAYTVDGGGFGEVEYQTFNAASCVVTCTGHSTHPGGAKDRMINASLVAMEFNALLPALERPEHTSGFEGFIHLTQMEGETEHAVLHYILRDHDAGKLEDKKRFVRSAAEQINRRYGQKVVDIGITDSYRNMEEAILPHWHLMDTAYAAIRACGTEPASVPVRGGTDGSRLSYMGLPCPNLCTGGHNGHGRNEFANIQEMEKCTKVLVNIAALYKDIEKTR
ncbi:MAG: peptidase T [Clostridia bacterium]|nr:peptidase T [Clostridia bacterium]